MSWTDMKSKMRNLSHPQNSEWIRSKRMSSDTKNSFSSSCCPALVAPAAQQEICKDLRSESSVSEFSEKECHRAGRTISGFSPVNFFLEIKQWHQKMLVGLRTVKRNVTGQPGPSQVSLSSALQWKSQKYILAIWVMSTNLDPIWTISLKRNVDRVLQLMSTLNQLHGIDSVMPSTLN